MERRPFTVKEAPFPERMMRAFPFVAGWVAGLFILGWTGHLSPLWVIGYFIFGTLIAIIAQVVLWPDPRYKTAALLVSPCPECGKTPMKFDRGSQGDFVFTCDQCRIEWMLDRSKS